MNMNNTVKKIILSPILEFYLKILCFNRIFKIKDNSALILPPTSPGSLGDEALVTGATDQLRKQGSKKISMVSYLDGSKWINSGPITENIELHKFFSKNSWKSRFTFAKAVSKYDKYYTLGADVMDGFYSEKDSLKRVELLSIAKKTGAKTTLLGFSFNANPEKSVIEALSKLPESIKIYARDPISHERLKKSLSRNVDLVADVAFLLTPKNCNEIKETEKWIKSQQKEKKIVVGINANCKLLSNMKNGTIPQLIDLYSNFLSDLWKKEKCALLLIPHDYRDIKGEINDVELSEKILNKLPKNIQPDCKILPSPRSAAEIKYIAGLVDIVISGRMHLAIAALGNETPVAGLTYQGKFEGLFKYFNLKNVSISPDESVIRDNLLNFFRSIIKRRKSISKQIKKRLPYVKKLSKKNFQ